MVREHGQTPVTHAEEFSDRQDNEGLVNIAARLGGPSRGD